MSNNPKFNKECVRKMIGGIRCGQVTTYGAISHALTGDKKSSQAVGTLIGRLGEEFPLKEYRKPRVNYHRVVYTTRIIPSKENAIALADENVPVGKGKVYWRVQKSYFDAHFCSPSKLRKKK